MVFTHLLAGLLVGLGATALGAGPEALLAGLAGGLLPDLDMVADHRRTLHFPVAYGAAATVLAVVATAAGSPASLAFATVFAAAWLHSAMDVLGSGRSLRPWKGPKRRAVYNHVLGRWHAPRRLVYDGSPGDLLLAAVLAAVAVVAGGPATTSIAAALVVPAVGYALCRRAIAARIPAEYESLSPYLKARLSACYRWVSRRAFGQRAAN